MLPATRSWISKPYRGPNAFEPSFKPLMKVNAVAISAIILAAVLLSQLPRRGFCRVWTKEETLDAVFLPLFAIFRTDRMLYE